MESSVGEGRDTQEKEYGTRKKKRKVVSRFERAVMGQGVLKRTGGSK